MPRAKLYKTPEQRACANRAKSKRYYEKKKAEINDERRAKRKKARLSEQRNNPVVIRNSQRGIMTTVNSVSSGITTWLQNLVHFQNRVRSLVGDIPVAFVDTICQEFMQTYDKGTIHEHVSTFGKFQKWILQCHDRVLQIAGVGPELESVQDVVNEVRSLNRWIDELLVYAMLGKEEFLEAYHTKKFEYQEHI